MASYFGHAGVEEIALSETPKPVRRAPPIIINRYSPVHMKPYIPSIVNILLLGKVGVGKARVVNEMFGQEVFENGVTTSVVGGVSQRETCFSKNSNNYRVKMFDTVGIKRGPNVKRTKTMAAIRKYLACIYPDGVNLAMLVYRHEDFSSTERKRFMYILNRLNEETVPLITALIITGCEDKNDSARKKIVSEFHSNHRMQGIGQFVLQGMYPVGLTNLRAVPDAMMEMYRAVNYRDTLILQEVLSQCYRHHVDTDSFFFNGRYHRGIFQFPWHYCPCYDRIYTCWRWGYTWEECLRVQQRDSTH